MFAKQMVPVIWQTTVRCNRKWVMVYVFPSLQPDSRKFTIELLPPKQRAKTDIWFGERLPYRQQRLSSRLSSYSQRRVRVLLLFHVHSTKNQDQSLLQARQYYSGVSWWLFEWIHKNSVGRFGDMLFTNVWKVTNREYTKKWELPSLKEAIKVTLLQLWQRYVYSDGVMTMTRSTHRQRP